MAFGPGLHVFPGGAVDASDADPVLAGRSVLSPAACAAAWAGDLEPSAAIAHHVCAVRELFEEAGILLAATRGGAVPDPLVLAAASRAGEPFAALVARLDLVLRTDLLVPLSRWVTPPVGVTRRYDARFYAAALPPGASVAPDGREVAAHEWLAPDAALDAMAAGRIGLWPPTATTLQQLAGARDLDDVRRRLAPVSPDAAPDVAEIGPLVTRFRLHGAGGVPGQVVHAYAVGRHRLVVADPGDPNEGAVEAILAFAAGRGARIAGILLTAPVPDRAAGSTSLALRVDAPILAGPGAVRVLASPVSVVTDGEGVRLADIPIRVHATPGTHPDHLAFELPEAGAVLVGDLDGPGATRSIPGPRDEAALGRSRERVARLGRPARLAAHG
jgi:glyoxylase-like metal-dependent hydrolase (beta-lactamase superfamily II)/8-oxo-dGTP pyrophosphatase MutT (NUDIX family)